MICAISEQDSLICRGNLLFSVPFSCGSWTNGERIWLILKRKGHFHLFCVVAISVMKRDGNLQAGRALNYLSTKVSWIQYFKWHCCAKRPVWFYIDRVEDKLGQHNEAAKIVLPFIPEKWGEHNHRVTTSHDIRWDLLVVGLPGQEGQWYCSFSLLLSIFDSSWGKAGLADPWAVMGMMKGTIAPRTSGA